MKSIRAIIMIMSSWLLIRIYSKTTRYVTQYLIAINFHFVSLSATFRGSLLSQMDVAFVHVLESLVDTKPNVIPGRGKPCS